MANPVIKKFIQKSLFKQKGAISSAKAVDFSTNALETRLTNAGIDLNLIKSQKDLDQALAFVKQIEDQVFAKKFSDTLKPDAEIIPITDPKKRLDPRKPIMGGTQDEKDMLQKSIDKNIKEATEKGDFTGIKNQLLRDPDIAREFALMKKFPTRTAEGEEAIPLAMRAKFDEEMGIKSVAPRDYSVEKLVSDFKKFGNATDKDIQMILGSGKSGQIPYVMDNYGMSYKDVINTLKRGEPLIEGMASGGRAGFKVGSPSKRAFLKAAGGIAALLTAIKSGLIGTGGKETTKQVVKESVKDVANTPPKYFFDLVNKIKILGNETKSISPRTKTTTYKNYELEEDLTTGDLTVVKQKGDPDFAYEEEVLIFRKGQADETTKGKTPPDEYEELTVRPDGDGKMKDVEDGIEPEGIKEIQEELSEGGGNIDELTLQKIKRGELAGGGLAYMLGE